MVPQLITSRQNARVRDLRAALRGRPPAGVAAVEGFHLLEEAQRAHDSGIVVETVFVRQSLAQIHLSGDAELLLLSDDVFDSIAATETSQGIAALVRKPTLAYVPHRGDTVVIAAGLQDPGNLGTLIRSAEAFGAAAVLLAESTVDPWNGKCLRASAGSVFRLPLPAFDAALHTALQRCGIRLLAAVPDRAATPAHAADLRNGCALLIGNEGNGLSPAMLNLADERITLAMPGPTESLNAAVAASVLLYEVQRQRGRA